MGMLVGEQSEDEVEEVQQELNPCLYGELKSITKLKILPRPFKTCRTKLQMQTLKQDMLLTGTPLN